jgi:hypothetical protein
VRRRRVLLSVVAVAAFLAVSFGVARFLNVETDERGQVLALLRAQARGDAPDMLDRLDGCRRSASCRAQVRANARRLRRPGEVKILALSSGTAYSLGSATGPTRVAWTVVDRGLPVVQCILVRRTGTVVAGRSVTLLRLSAPIHREASC